MPLRRWPDGRAHARTRSGGTPLGPAEGWTERLKGAIEQMLATPQIASIAVGPERVFLYTDEAAKYYERDVPFLFTTGYDQSAIPSRFADVFRCEKPIGSGELSRS